MLLDGGPVVPPPLPVPVPTEENGRGVEEVAVEEGGVADEVAASFGSRRGGNRVEAIRSDGLIIKDWRPRLAMENLGRLRGISRAPALNLDKVMPREQQADSAQRR